MAVALEIDLAPVEEILEKSAASRNGDDEEFCSGDIISILQEIQRIYGYLPFEALRRVSQRTGVPESRIQGVVTFYAQFHREPRGRHRLTLCCGTSCHVRGGNKLLDAVKKVLDLEPGSTSADSQVTLETAACLGACALSPVMVINGKYYGKLTPRKGERLVRMMAREEQT